MSTAKIVEQQIPAAADYSNSRIASTGMLSG